MVRKGVDVLGFLRRHKPEPTWEVPAEYVVLGTSDSSLGVVPEEYVERGALKSGFIMDRTIPASRLQLNPATFSERVTCEFCKTTQDWPLNGKCTQCGAPLPRPVEAPRQEWYASGSAYTAYPFISGSCAVHTTDDVPVSEYGAGISLGDGWSQYNDVAEPFK